MDSYRDRPFDGQTRNAASAAVPFSPKPLPLQLRLLALVAGTLLPLLVLTAVIIFQSYDIARQAAAEQVLRVTRGTMVAVDRELLNQMAALDVLALAPALQSGNFEAFTADAERFLTRFPAGTAIFLADAAGTQLFNTNRGGTIDRPEVLEAIAAVFARKRPQVSNIYLSRRTGELAFTVNVPVLRNGEVVYNLGFNSPRAAFLEILTGLDLPSGWVIAVLDRMAHHVARRPALAQDTVTSASESLKAELALADERIRETVSVEGTRVLTVFSRSQETGWLVAVGVPVGHFQEPTLRIVTIFSIGAVLILVGGFFAIRIASQLVRAEGHRELLVNELNHRVKNTLSAVQAIVWRGLRNSGAVPEARQSIDARLQALSNAHNILSRKNWEGAYVEDVIASIMAPYAGPQGSRMRLHGPHVALHPRVAIALAMIINELATNAVKYGALSAGSGLVNVTWMMMDETRLKIMWSESGGPPVQPPAQTGYGTKFIERAVGDELGGKYTASFPAEGMTGVIEITL